MRKRILLFASILLLLALLSGCTLALPETAGTAGNGTGDTFCGFWLTYDRLENKNDHVFDIDSDTEQMLIQYMIPAEGGREPYTTSKTGFSVGDASTNLSYKDDSEEVEIKGTMYLINDEDQSLMDQGYREVWLQSDVVQSFRDFYIQPPEGMNNEDALKPGETMIVYIPEEQISLHGKELTKLAEDAGAHLILKSESPRELRVAQVFQRPDGTVYADENGTRFIMSSSTLSTTQSVETTKTINGKTTKKKVTATIFVQWIDELKTVRLLEMNSNNTFLRSSEATLKDIQAWAKQESPYTVSNDAAYLIVEETYETKQGTTYVKRTVYDRPPKNNFNKPLHTFHFPRDNGLTETVSMNIGF